MTSGKFVSNLHIYFASSTYLTKNGTLLKINMQLLILKENILRILVCVKKDFLLIFKKLK